MAGRKRGLGKGISALIGGASLNEVTSSSIHRGSDNNVIDSLENNTATVDCENVIKSSKSDSQNEYRRLPVEFLQPGVYQPRRSIAPDALEELSKSIQAQGVMQPLVVRPIADGHYEIIAGERRWRASQLAGLQDIPCVIRDVSDEAALALAIIENIQREDLSPMEQAVGLQRLKTEFDLTHQQIADAVGRSRASITNLLRLLNLHDSVKQMLDVGDLETGHAKCLLSLEPEIQVQLAKQIIEEGMSVRMAEAFVKKFSDNQNKPLPIKSLADKPNADINLLQEELAQKVGAAVKIHHSHNGKGRLVIKYTSVDELEGILSHIN